MEVQVDVSPSMQLHGNRQMYGKCHTEDGTAHLLQRTDHVYTGKNPEKIS